MVFRRDEVVNGSTAQVTYEVNVDGTGLRRVE